MEKGFQLLPMVFVCVASEDDMSRVGFGRSEAVSGIDDPLGLFVDRDVCARTTDVGMRWCNVYLDAQRIQRKVR